MKQVRWNPSPEPERSGYERLAVITAGSPILDQTPVNDSAHHLWLGIHLPFLALESLDECSAQGPFAVFEQHRQGQQIVVANQLARKSGILEGMSLTAARTLNPDLFSLCRNRSLEHRRLRQLATTAGQWTPRITLLEDGLLLDISGSTRLFGGMTQLIEQIHAWIRTESIDPCVSLMPTAASALLCARTGKASRITAKECIPSVVRSLPAAHLITDAQSHRLLVQLGARTIGDLIRLPRDGLTRRFGPDLLVRIDRLLGRLPDPQAVFKPALQFKKSCALDAEITDIEFLYPAIRYLLEKLSAYLSVQQVMLERLQWRFTGERGARYRLPVHLAKPRGDIDELERLSRLALEGLKISDPIVNLELCAHRFTPRIPAHKTLFDQTTWGDAHDDSLVERLQTRLGKHAVHGIQAQVDHRPENAWRRCRPGEAGPVSGDRKRPLWLLPSPKAIHISKGCLTIGTQILRLDHHCERICSGWWDHQPIRRDYYRASSGSIQAWIFRDLDSGHWRLHGIF